MSLTRAGLVGISCAVLAGGGLAAEPAPKEETRPLKNWTVPGPGTPSAASCASGRRAEFFRWPIRAAGCGLPEGLGRRSCGEGRRPGAARRRQRSGVEALHRAGRCR